jgi:hypothetical protein
MLKDNWITDGWMDYEYKKYILLAFLSKCKEQFQETRLYPPISELMGHYQSLNELRSDLEKLKKSFPKEVSSINWKKLMFDYQEATLNDETIAVMQDIISFAIPQISETLKEGQDIYNFVEDQLEFSPVGLLPVYVNDGFFFIRQANSNVVHIYQYHYSMITHQGEQLRSLSTEFIETQSTSLHYPVEEIKADLNKRSSEMPNSPAWYCVSRMSFPIRETILPVTKRLLIRELSTAA